MRGEGWYAMGGVGGVEVFPVHQGQGCTKVWLNIKVTRKSKSKCLPGGTKSNTLPRGQNS